MTHDAHPTPDNDEFLESALPADDASEVDYEEISSDEVDMIVSALESLIDSTTSENIRAYLDEAAENIYRLVYEDEAGDAAEWDADDDLSEAA